MSVEILDSLPKPERKQPVHKGPRKDKYPFAHLKVGQGFFVTKAGIAATAKRYAEKTGHKYRTYAGEKDGIKGRYVERIA